MTDSTMNAQRTRSIVYTLRGVHNIIRNIYMFRLTSAKYLLFRNNAERDPHLPFNQGHGKG